MLDGLRSETDHDDVALDAAGAWVLSVDPTVVRAHADAAGARHVPLEDVAALLEELATAPVKGWAARAGV